ncbi:MAG: hypothetical protein HUU57_10360, partial [Bdellovibrio sp.]|nr:hypothetical protein [Bdellovibrio sp.]
STSERRKIVFDSLPDKQKFDKLIKQYEEAYEYLPKVVAEVLYYAFLKKRYWPENVDDRLEQAQEDGYISIDEDEQSIEPNFDDPKVKRLNKAVMRIKIFLESESESEFSDQFIEENDYSPNLDNKRFWKDFLRI